MERRLFHCSAEVWRRGQGREGDLTMTIKAYILVVADPGQTKKVLEAIRAIPEVRECHEVMGPYDIVVELEVENLTDVPPILGQRLRVIPGIESTTSLLTLPE